MKQDICIKSGKFSEYKGLESYKYNSYCESAPAKLISWDSEILNIDF